MLQQTEIDRVMIRYKQRKKANERSRKRLLYFAAFMIGICLFFLARMIEWTF